MIPPLLDFFSYIIVGIIWLWIAQIKNRHYSVYLGREYICACQHDDYAPLLSLSEFPKSNSTQIILSHSKAAQPYLGKTPPKEAFRQYLTSLNLRLIA